MNFEDPSVGLLPEGMFHLIYRFAQRRPDRDWGRAWMKSVAEEFGAAAGGLGLVTRGQDGLPTAGSGLGSGGGGFEAALLAWVQTPEARTDDVILRTCTLGQSIQAWRRRDVVDDAGWYGGRHFDGLCRRLGLDDFLMCSAPIGPDVWIGSALHKRAGAADFAATAVDQFARLFGVFVADLARAVMPTDQIGLDAATRERLRQLGVEVTDRQAEVLALLLEGLSEEDIGRRLYRSKHTVHDHAKRIYAGLGVNTRPELMALLGVRASWTAPVAASFSDQPTPSRPQLAAG